MKQSMHMAASFCTIGLTLHKMALYAFHHGYVYSVETDSKPYLLAGFYINEALTLLVHFKLLIYTHAHEKQVNHLMFNLLIIACHSLFSSVLVYASDIKRKQLHWILDLLFFLCFNKSRRHFCITIIYCNRTSLIRNLFWWGCMMDVSYNCLNLVKDF